MINIIYSRRFGQVYNFIFTGMLGVSVKVSVISVLGKIQDVIRVIFVQKMRENWLKITFDF